MPTRRQFLTVAGAVLMADRISLAAALETIPPADAGFQADLPERFAAMQASGRLENLHGVVLLRGGCIVFERYLTGGDEVWGRPVGQVAFGPDTLHDLRSVTKSIVGLLYGIALAEGRVPGPDEPLMAQFPEYPDLAKDPARARMTIRHALTMTLGTAWNEDLPYIDPASSEIAMEMAPDRYRFVLERPVVAEPGRRWIYNGGATALLGRLIARGTGRRLPDYARAILFDPLGAGPTEWASGRDSEPSAASGLRMTPRDLARVGHMILQRGQSGGRAVVPADWVEASFRPAIELGVGRHYGFQSYLGRLKAGDGRVHPWVGAVGNGGQRLFVLPESELVMVVTAGNYNRPGQDAPSLALLREVFLPALAG